MTTATLFLNDIVKAGLKMRLVGAGILCENCVMRDRAIEVQIKPSRMAIATLCARLCAPSFTAISSILRLTVLSLQ